MESTLQAEVLGFPDARHRYLGPLLLAPFAADLARRLSRLNAGPLLEIAADTGALTLALATTMSAGLTIIATEADPALFQAARARGGLTRVTWERAAPESLPFPNGQFGIIACQFALATLPDRVGVMREVRRVMQPGGRFKFSVPGPLRFSPLADCVHAALAALFPVDPPGFLARGLHGYADDEAIDDDLTAAGFTDAMYTNVDLSVTTSAMAAAFAYCLGTPLREEIGARGGHREAVQEAVTAALRRRFGDGPITAGMRALVVSASA